MSANPPRMSAVWRNGLSSGIPASPRRASDISVSMPAGAMQPRSSATHDVLAGAVGHRASVGRPLRGGEPPSRLPRPPIHRVDPPREDREGGAPLPLAVAVEPAEPAGEGRRAAGPVHREGVRHDEPRDEVHVAGCVGVLDRLLGLVVLGAPGGGARSTPRRRRPARARQARHGAGRGTGGDSGRCRDAHRARPRTGCPARAAAAAPASPSSRGRRRRGARSSRPARRSDTASAWRLRVERFEQLRPHVVRDGRLGTPQSPLVGPAPGADPTERRPKVRRRRPPLGPGQEAGDLVGARSRRRSPSPSPAPPPHRARAPGAELQQVAGGAQARERQGQRATCGERQSKARWQAEHEERDDVECSAARRDGARRRASGPSASAAPRSPRRARAGASTRAIVRATRTDRSTAGSSGSTRSRAVAMHESSTTGSLSRASRATYATLGSWSAHWRSSVVLP